MANTYKFKADWSSLLDGLKHQNKLNKALEKNLKMFIDSQKRTEAWSNALAKVSDKAQGLTAKSIGFAREGNKFKSAITGLAAGGMNKLSNTMGKIKDPFNLLVGGVMKLKMALISSGIGAILIMLTGAVMVFKKMWELNMGGIQKSVFSVWGKIQNAIGRVTAVFVKFVEKLGPVVEPFFKAMEAIIIPLIDYIEQMFTSFLEGGVAVDLFKGTIMPILDGFVQLLKFIIPAIQELIGGLFKVGPTGESGFGKLLKTIGRIVGLVFKWLGALIKFWSAIGLFKILGFIINLIAEGLNVVLEIIEFIIEGIIKAIEWFTKLFKAKDKEGEATKNKVDEENKRNEAVKQKPVSPQAMAAQTTNNNKSSIINSNPVVTVHSSGPISAESAPMIGDILAKSISIQRGAL